MGRSAAFDDELLAQTTPVYDTALRLTHSAAAAEDLTQETFARAVGAAERFEPGSSMRAWVLSILLNLFRNQQRARARHAEVELDEEELPPVDEPEPASFEALTPQVLDAAISGLPLRLREAVVLRDLQGLSYQQVSEALRIPVGTVMSRLYRGRALLRKTLVARVFEDTNEARSRGRAS